MRRMLGGIHVEAMMVMLISLPGLNEGLVIDRSHDELRLVHPQQWYAVSPAVSA